MWELLRRKRKAPKIDKASANSDPSKHEKIPRNLIVRLGGALDTVFEKGCVGNMETEKYIASRRALSLKTPYRHVLFSTLFEELALRRFGIAQLFRSGEMVKSIFGGIPGRIRAQREKKTVTNRRAIFLRASSFSIISCSVRGVLGHVIRCTDRINRRRAPA